MANYYAFDMTNGKTYIGRADWGTGVSSVRLEDVVVTNTARSSFETANHPVFDLPEYYRFLYKEAFKKKFSDLPICHLPKDTHNNVRNSIAEWYLGEDIVKIKKSKK